MKTGTKVALVLVAVIALTAGIYTFRKGSTHPSGKRVAIAMNLALSGPVAAASGEYPTAFQMGVDEAAKRLGIPASTFSVNLADNKGTAKDAMTGLQVQDAAGFDVYISGLSYASVAIAPELDKRPTPHLVIAFDSFITQKGQNRFRILPNYKIQGPKYVEFAQARGAKRVFVLTANNAFVNEQFAGSVEPGLKGADIEYARESFDLSTSDYRTLALKALAFKPDLIMIDCLSFQMLPLIQSIRSLGYSMDHNVLCSMDFFFLPHEAEAAGELQGVVAISPPFEIPGVVAGADAWRARYRAVGGKEPNYIQAYAYDTAQILFDCYQRFGNLNSESLVKMFPYEGICGKMNLDADRDLVTDLGYITVSKTGQREALTSAANHQ